MNSTQHRQAVVHGRQVSVDIDLPDGTRVDIVVSPVQETFIARTFEELPGFGAAQDSPEEMDAFDNWCREQRRIERSSQGCEP